MNKIVKLPLFLGSVCLVFCTSLAIVVNICEPIIEKNNEKKEKKAYLSLYDNIKEENINVLNDVELKAYPQIQKIATIEHNVLSYVYSLSTKDPQSGNITFMLGISSKSNKIDAYQIVSNNNSGYASSFEDNQFILTGLMEYSNGGDFIHTAGSTKTEKVFKDAVDQALNHYQNNFVSKGGNE